MAAKVTNGPAIKLTINGAAQKIEGGNGVDVIDLRDTAGTSNDGYDFTTTSGTYNIAGGNGDDTVWGSARNEIIWGDSLGSSGTNSDNGADQLHGGGGADQIYGGNGDDKIWGDEGNDKLFGDNGADRLTGGLGGDEQTGGKGGDKFIYLLTTDSTAAAGGIWDPISGDWIKDFNRSEGDRLDFSGFTDGAGNPITLTWSDTAGGAYKIWSDGSYVYADTNGSGGADLVIKVAGVGANDFIGVNHAPIDADETAISTGDATDDGVAITGNVLTNASDPDGDTVVVDADSVGMQTGSWGTLTLAADGSYSYVVTDESIGLGFSGTETFTYTVSDGHGGFNTSTISIDVSGSNDAPALTGTPASLVNGSEDTTYTISEADLLAGYADVEDDTLSVANLTATNGTLTDNNDGTWDFTPDPDYNGTVDLSYDVEDGNGGVTAATQSFSLDAVNDAPELTGTQASLVNGTEDTSYTLSATDLLAGYADVEDDTLSVANLTATNGTLTDNNDGTWDFTPDPDYNGTVDLSYDVEDGNGGVTAATQSFSLDAVNDAPELTGTQASLVNGTEDTSYTLSATDLLAGYADVEDDTLSVANLTATNGTLTDNNDGTWDFTPDPDYNGAVDLNYDVEDGNGGITAATQSFSLEAVNDDPTITAPNSGSDPTTIAKQENTGAAVTTVQATDIDGGALNYTIIGGADALKFSLNPTSGALAFFAAPDFENPTDLGANNSYIVQVQVDDGLGGADVQTITVNVTNDAADDQAPVPPPFGGGGDPNDFDLAGVQGGDDAFDESGTPLVPVSTTTQNAETVVGTSGDDTISANGGNDIVYGRAGGDKIDGDGGDDLLFGQAGIDIIDGKGGNDKIYGGSGADDITGNTDNDTIYGGSGNDTITGANGNDIIVGGYGADILNGGNDSDTFVYLSKLDTGDTINNYQDGVDVIDLSVFNITLAAVTVVTGTNTVINVNTDGVAGTDLQITLTGVHTPTFDFIV